MIEPQELIQRCLLGDRIAQKRLYDTYKAKFYGICLRYMDNQVDAEEVLQDSFIKIFTELSKFRGEGSFEGWMKRIVVNEALQTLRKKKNIFLSLDWDKADEFMDDFNTNELEDDHQNMVNLLLNILHNMPMGYRTIINLYIMEGFKHSEIAQQLGISEGTSKSQLNRAKKYMQDILQKQLLGNS